MAWLSILARLVVVILRTGKLAVVKAVARIWFLRKNNIWALLVMTSIVVIGNWPELMVFVETLNPVPLAEAIGLTLGRSLQVITENLQAVPAATGWEYLELAGSTLYHVATILWYFKFLMFMALRANPTESPLVVYGLGSIVFVLLVMNVEMMVPVGELIGAAEQLPAMFDVDRMVPWAETANQSIGENTTNITVVEK